MRRPNTFWLGALIAGALAASLPASAGTATCSGISPIEPTCSAQTTASYSFNPSSNDISITVTRGFIGRVHARYQTVTGWREKTCIYGPTSAVILYCAIDSHGTVLTGQEATVTAAAEPWDVMFPPPVGRYTVSVSL